MKKILITGGLGFIGTHLLKRLVETEDCVIDIVDNLSNNSLPPEEAKHPKVRKVYTCSFDKFDLHEKYDEIYHLASPVGPAGVLHYAGTMAQLILNDSMRVAKYAFENDAKVIFVSTSEVYGKDPGNNRQKEDIEKVVPPKITVRLEYGVGKLMTEICIHNYALHHPFRYNIIRPFNIVGVGQSSKAGFVLPRFVDAALRGKDITVFGQGTQRRTFTHVKDIVDAMLKMMHQDMSGETFNIGNAANELSVMQVAQKVKAATNSTSQIKCVDPKTIYGKDYEEAWNKIPDTTKAQTMLEWAPQYSFDEILAEIVADMKKLLAENKKRPNQE